MSLPTFKELKRDQMIEVDITTLYQIIGFFVLLFIITKFLSGPLQKVLDERDKRIGGATREAEELEKSMASGLTEYDDKLKEATLSAMEERANMRKEAHGEETVILEKAREDAGESLEKLRADIQEGRSSALAKLKEEAASLSRNIADKVLEKKVIAILLPLLLTLVPAASFASTEGGEGGSTGMGWKIFNFILMAIAIYLVWKKKIKGDLDKRGTDIQEALEVAKNLKASAEAKEKEYKTKLATLDSKVAQIRNELALEAQAERERILAEAAQTAKKLTEQAKLIAEQETEKAKNEIRAEVAEIAIGLTEDILKKELTDDDQQRLAKDYLKGLRLN